MNAKELKARIKRSRRLTLVKFRSAAHEAFDAIWRGGYMSREDAYQWLCREIGLTRETCHFGRFDVELCGKVRHLSKAKSKALKALRRISWKGEE